ncbi:alkaline phosphatase [Thermatribacter velox]|uniref:Alkaline phosphatase n=1 Tax=Thermatribacter velox TaxID=3039681 RepID=A0ABZ2YBH4_9BACT
MSGKLRYFWVAIVCMVGLFVGQVAFAAGVKYLFLFIGDGMGLASIHATELYLNDVNSEQVGKEHLSFTRFPVVGLMSTFDAGSYITDSASAITAMITGQKTRSGIINLDAERTRELTTLAEEAKSAGMKVGVVSTVSLDHATPAGMYAHTPSRNNYYEIALQLAESGFDYFAGGGFRYPTGKDKSQENIFDILTQNGYRVVQSRQEFETLTPPAEKLVVINPTLDTSSAMPYAIDRSADDFSLAELTRKGIELLDNPNGFFMMVEGGKIDWACHANDIRAAIGDILDFEQAVAEAIAFSKQHPEETLIIVTADHATGGLSLGYALTGSTLRLELLENQKVSHEVFAQTVKAYAHNTPPDKQSLQNFWPVIQENFGLLWLSDEEKAQLTEKAKAGDLQAAKTVAMAVSEYELARLEEAFAASMSGEIPQNEEAQLRYEGYDPLTVTLTHLMGEKAGISWTTYSHTGEPVPVFAMGAGAELFDGWYDNTDLYAKMKQALAITAQVK